MLKRIPLYYLLKARHHRSEVFSATSAPKVRSGKNLVTCGEQGAAKKYDDPNPIAIK